MAQSFPLYDDLLTQITKDTSMVIDPSRICRTLSIIDKEHAEIVFLLIHHHNILENGISLKIVPYSGTTGAMSNRDNNKDSELKCVNFYFTSLPAKLKSIIAKYLEIVAK